MYTNMPARQTTSRRLICSVGIYCEKNEGGNARVQREFSMEASGRANIPSSTCINREQICKRGSSSTCAIIKYKIPAIQCIEGNHTCIPTPQRRSSYLEIVFSCGIPPVFVCVLWGSLRGRSLLYQRWAYSLLEAADYKAHAVCVSPSNVYYTLDIF